MKSKNHINSSEDFNQSAGVAVRIEKFSDSSIDIIGEMFYKNRIVGIIGLEVKKD